MVVPIADELRCIAKGEILSDDWSKDPCGCHLQSSDFYKEVLLMVRWRSDGGQMAVRWRSDGGQKGYKLDGSIDQGCMFYDL